MPPDPGGSTPAPPSCRELVARLDDLVEDSLPPAQRGPLRWHAAGCRSCRCYVASYRATLELVRDVPWPSAGEPPSRDALVGSVMAAWGLLEGRGSP